MARRFINLNGKAEPPPPEPGDVRYRVEEPKRLPRKDHPSGDLPLASHGIGEPLVLLGTEFYLNSTASYCYVNVTSWL